MSAQLAHRMTEQERRKKDLILYAAKFVLVLGTTALFGLVWMIYYAERIFSPFYGKGNYVVCFLYAVLYFAFGRLYGGFQVTTSRITGLVYAQYVALIFTHAMMYVVICLLSYKFVHPLPLVAATLSSMGFASVWSVFANKLNGWLFPPRRTVVIYDYIEENYAVEQIEKLTWKFKVTESINMAEGMSAVLDAVERSEVVFMCGVVSSERNTILKYCIQHDIPAYIRPKIGDLLVSGAKRMHLNNLPVLYCERNRTSAWYTGIKRAVDIVVSFLGLLVTGPFLLIIAACIKLYDHGPVLYKQCRLTKDGKTFEIYKFRSMRTDAEQDGIARLASQNDTRITPIGKFIRKVRIDELPQLLNILRGEMSLVGPRPERPEIAEQYEQEIAEFSLRLQAKAGLTGYAQVYGKYNTNPYDKLQMDLMYIANQSIVQDLKLIFATIKILFMPESTEGISEENTTAVSTDAQSDSLKNWNECHSNRSGDCDPSYTIPR